MVLLALAAQSCASFLFVIIFVHSAIFVFYNTSAYDLCYPQKFFVSRRKAVHYCAGRCKLQLQFLGHRESQKLLGKGSIVVSIDDGNILLIQITYTTHINQSLASTSKIFRRCVISRKVLIKRRVTFSLFTFVVLQLRAYTMIYLAQK